MGITVYFGSLSGFTVHGKIKVGCVACRKMEFVLEDVRQQYPGKVNVIFLNILEIKNQDMMKYYGIAAIPAQVLLDQNGKEYFRHTGYFSFDELRKQFKTH